MHEPHAILSNENDHPAYRPGSAALRGNWDRTTPFDADAYVDHIVRQHARGKGTSKYVILDNLFNAGPHEPSIMDKRGKEVWYDIIEKIGRQIEEKIGPELLIFEDPRCGKSNRRIRDNRIATAIAIADSSAAYTGFGIYYPASHLRLFGGPMAYRDLDNFEANISMAKAAQPHQRFIPWLPYVGFSHTKGGVTYTFDATAVTKMAAFARGAGALQVIAWYPRKRYAAEQWYETMQAIRDGGFAVPIDWDKAEVTA